jgi:hypothetical protein
MITGYNTDVRHNDVVFHVQTEDKGASNPFIESLVYVGGQVLASKRASYAELLAQGKDDKAITALMDHQHRTMIAAIRYGKFDEKLQSLRTGRGATNVLAQTPIVPLSVGPMAVPLDMQATLGPAAPVAVRTSTAEIQLPPPAAPPPPVLSAPPAGLTPMAPPTLPRSPTLPPVSPVSPAIPPPIPTSPTLVRPAGSVLAAAKVDRSLDQVILEYLTSEADQEQLLLFLEGEAQLNLGQPAAVALRASSSKSGMPVSGAQVSVKMISTAAEPRMLAAGRTDDEGALALAFDIPPLTRGTAALIITAVASIGRAELKQLL